MPEFPNLFGLPDPNKGDEQSCKYLELQHDSLEVIHIDCTNPWGLPSPLRNGGSISSDL